MPLSTYFSTSAGAPPSSVPSYNSGSNCNASNSGPTKGSNVSETPLRNASPNPLKSPVKRSFVPVQMSSAILNGASTVSTTVSIITLASLAGCVMSSTTADNVSAGCETACQILPKMFSASSTSSGLSYYVFP